MEIINWIIANWQTVLLGITGIVTGASIIAKLTPWTADDKIVQWILDVIHVVSLTKQPPA